VVPAAVRSYVTAAFVAVVSVTASTFELTAEASGLAENDEIADENFDPFSSRARRSLLGVEESKNFAQLVFISAIAAAEAPVPALAVPGVAELLATGAEVVGAAGEEELELLEEQADSAATSIRPSTGAVRIWCCAVG
jgi:hypothetical protein